MSEQGGIIHRWRPDGFAELLPGLVKDCIAAGEIQVEEEELPKIEAFIRHCLNVGADAAIEGVRAYGADAQVRGRNVEIIVSKVKVPGRPQFLKTHLQYKDRGGYQGPGRLVFVPADKDVFKVPPGKLSGGGNGGKHEG